MCAVGVDVYICANEGNRVAVMAAVRARLGVSLFEAKQLVDKGDICMGQSLMLGEAERLVRTFERAGIQAWMR